MNNDGTISELEMERLVDDMKVLLGVSESAPCYEGNSFFSSVFRFVFSDLFAFPFVFVFNISLLIFCFRRKVRK